MKRCWIHIGMHKTGTTSVQVNLAKAPGPRDWRILTTGGRPNMGMALFAMFATDPEKFHLFAKKGLTAAKLARRGRRLRRRMARTIAAAPEETIVISGEAACLIDRAGVGRMRDFLAPLFDEIRVVGYVRPPMGFKTSIFQQHLKYGACPLDFRAINVPYRRKFAKFDDIFGRENVVLCKFAPSRFPDGCMVADFCQTIGIVPPPREAIRRVNEGMTREACGILYAYRKFGPGVPRGKDFIRENNRLVAPLLALSGTKFRVSRELLDAGSAENAAHLRWMENRLGESLAEPPAAPGDEVACEADLLAISRASCEEFLQKVREIHGVKVAAPVLPAAGPVPPERVAELVEACRLAIRRAADARKSRRRVTGFFRNLLKRATRPAHPGRTK